MKCPQLRNLAMTLSCRKSRTHDSGRRLGLTLILRILSLVRLAVFRRGLGHHTHSFIFLITTSGPGLLVFVGHVEM
ncbi:hypothetical protein F5B19DRAFT_454219 [Rostrohypoxylon terebratum]|nr:hypothetical protein F5B19DRAFT_454219 [Rostrohypoxylon terebratum]